MQLLYKTPVLKQLQKIPPKERVKILSKLEALAQTPLIGKQLKGELKRLRSLRSWPYRIIYQLEKDNITIYSVAHRQSVYKK